MVRLGNLQIPLFIKAHHNTNYPCNFSMQGHPNRGTTLEDDNQATGMGKEDLEKVKRCKILEMLHCTVCSSKVSHGDGCQ